MANCTNCGNPLDASDTKCAHCGTIVTNQSQGQRRSGYTSTQQIAYPKSTHSGSSSIQVPILAVLSLVAGIESFLYVGKIMPNISVSQLNSLPSMVGFITPYTPYILEIAGVLALVATYGYLRRTSWAWKLGLGSGILTALTIIAPNLIGFLLGIVCLGMLMMPSVRSSLRRF
jgi:hypothetical protein